MGTSPLGGTGSSLGARPFPYTLLEVPPLTGHTRGPGTLSLAGPHPLYEHCKAEGDAISAPLSLLVS